MTRTTWRFSRPEYKSLAQALSLLLVCFAATPAVDAGIVSFSGVTPLPGPPAPSVLPGAQPPLPTPIVFNELAFVGGAGIAPAGGIPVDHVGTPVVVTPVVTSSVVSPLLVSGVIPAGTPFESYLFHFDPLDSPIPTPANFYPGSSITFSTPIIGVQLFSSAAPLVKPVPTPYVGKLETGDAAVALNGGPPLGYYPGGVAFRGLEEDAMAIAAGGLTITLAGEADGVEIDQVRIFVAVPEPGSLVMAFIAILGIMGLGRTRS